MRTKIALGLSTTAVVVSMGAIGLSAVNNSNRVSDIKRISTTSQHVSHQACLRTRRLAPDLIAFFASFDGTAHELPATTLAEYRETVPKRCP